MPESTILRQPPIGLPGSRCARLAFLTVLLSLTGPTGGHAACGDPAGVRCVPAVDMLNAIVRVGAGFVTAGSAARDGVVLPTLLRLSGAGEITRTTLLPWPGERAPDPKAGSEPRRLVALPGGDVVVVGQAHHGDDPSTFSWAMRVTEAGRVVWSRVFSEPPATVVLAALLHDPATDRIMMVGRLTEGSDDGQCLKWSQSLAVVVQAADGRVVGRVVRGDKGSGPTNREALFDIAPGDRPGRFVVAGFNSVPVRRPGRRCLDAAYVGALMPGQGGSLALSTLGRFAAREASEVPFSIRPAGPPSTYLLAGQRRDEVGVAPAALAVLVQTAPRFAVVRPLATSYPSDGSDKSGSDRFRVVAVLPEEKRVVLAGSVSTSEKAQNQAMWQTAASDLARFDPPAIVATPGTDVNDAAVGQDGTVLLVGRWTDGDGRRVGFIHTLTGSSSAAAFRPVAAASRTPALARVRQTPVASLPVVGDSYRLPPEATTVGGVWGGGPIPAGKQASLSFTLARPATLRVAASADRGQADLLVVDGEGRPVSFVNDRRSAAEMLIVTFPAGDYAVKLLAHGGAGSYQIRLEPAAEIPVRALGLAQRLTEDDRRALAAQLAALGYAVGAEPEMAFGAETIRALIAAREGPGPPGPVGPGDLARVVSDMVQGR